MNINIIYQSTASECTLACLAMVSGYHGCLIEVGNLRARFPQSGKAPISSS
ncbi:cysteine peptidase family C39 domain-containing protein [Roseateles sp. BYS180W]|uniref:Cysteine peptidase family C39 domain-containing protein n=1 Tax=Roseateles rivi TaxID=3299028 RepID=A0ABW7FTF7_9BURK